MVRLYWGTGGSDYTDVPERDALEIQYEHTVITDHIPYSNRSVNTEQGYRARIAFSTFMKTEADRNTLLGHLPDVFQVSIDSGVSYRAAIEVGHKVKREWLNLWPIDLDLLCDADAVSATPHTMAGGALSANAGNRPASPVFTITVGTTITSGLTISDGTRTLVVAGTFLETHVLVLSDWKAMDDADEVTLNMDGDFPLVPAAGEVTFAFTGITAPATEVSITYRDTWR